MVADDDMFRVSRPGRIMAAGLALVVISARPALADGSGGGRGSQGTGGTASIGASAYAYTYSVNGGPPTAVNGGGGGGGGGGAGSGPPVYWIPAGSEPGPSGSTDGTWYLGFAVPPGCPTSGTLPAGCPLGAAQGAVWVPNGGAPPAGPAPPPTAAQLAAAAAKQLPLPEPGGPYTNPAKVQGHQPDTVVNFPTWLWVDAGNYKSQAVTASAGGVSATTTATPTAVVYNMGDGGSVSCQGPGAVYDLAQPAEAQQTTCDYTYRQSTDGRGAYTISATINWSVVWTSNVGQSGSIGTLTTSSSGSLNVDQIESVVVPGG